MKKSIVGFIIRYLIFIMFVTIWRIDGYKLFSCREL